MKAPAAQPKLDQNNLLRPADVAEILAIDVKTVYSLAANGDLRGCQIRGSLRFDPLDVSDYIFLSKLRRDPRTFSFTRSDIQDLFDLAASRMEETKNHLEKLLAGKSNRAEAPMKK
jgi:hypothetical protein